MVLNYEILAVQSYILHQCPIVPMSHCPPQNLNMIERLSAEPIQHKQGLRENHSTFSMIVQKKMGHWDIGTNGFCIVRNECGRTTNVLIWIIIYIINIYINNIYNNFNRPFLSELKNRKHKCPFVPLSLCPVIWHFIEFLLARHSSNKFGSAPASFVILTFEINRTIIAGNYCFASEIFVLLHCQQSRRNLRPN